MAKQGVSNDDRQDEVQNNQAEREGEKPAAYNGESVSGSESESRPVESNVNPMSPAEEAERQQAENYPRPSQTFEKHDEAEKVRQGFASTSRARIGRVVVVHEDVEHDGELYKAGVQDLPVEVADALMADDKAFEPAGKKRGR